MRRLLKSALALIVVCGAVGAPASGGPLAAAGDEQAVLEADRALVQAIAKADKTAVSGLLDANFTWTDSAGKTRTRTQVLQDLAAPAGGGGTGGDAKVRAYGQVGVVTDARGKLHVVRVWVKRQAGWRALVSQDTTLSGPAAPAGPGSADCENPCQTVPYKPKTEAERGVISSWQALERAVTNHDAAGWAPHIADEFLLISSTRDKPLTKVDRMAILNKQKQTGEAAAPPPLVSAHMFEFGDTVVMTSEHQPRNEKPTHVTRVWVKRNGVWQLAFSQQTTMEKAAGG